MHATCKNVDRVRGREEPNLKGRVKQGKRKRTGALWIRSVCGVTWTGRQGHGRQDHSFWGKGGCPPTQGVVDPSLPRVLIDSGGDAYRYEPLPSNMRSWVRNQPRSLGVSQCLSRGGIIIENSGSIWKDGIEYRGRKLDGLCKEGERRDHRGSRG